MRAVNLLPPELRPGHRWARLGRGIPARRVFGASGIAAGVLAIALMGLVVHERGVVADRESALAEVQARLVAAEAKAAEVRAAQAASAARLAAVRDVITRRVVWEDVMRDLSRVLPANVYLQSMQVAAAAQTPPADGTAAAPTGFTIVGFADSQNRVAQVLDRLALLPWLADVSLTSSVRGGGSDTATPVQFTIGATFSSTGGR
jgi:Tfp pilus assembly protein PilN